MIAPPRVCPPPLWERFTRHLELSPAQSRLWWTALVRSTWSRPQELRQRFLLTEVCRIDREHFAHTATSPGNLVTVLEDLVRSHHLTRTQANIFEEAILRKITREAKGNV